MDLFLSCELTGLSLPPSQVHGSLARKPHWRLRDSGSPDGNFRPCAERSWISPRGQAAAFVRAVLKSSFREATPH